MIKDNPQLRETRKNILLRFENIFTRKGFEIDRRRWFLRRKRIYTYEKIGKKGMSSAEKREYRKRYYRENKKRYSEYRKEWRKNNPKWREDNKGRRAKERKKRWYKNHPEYFNDPKIRLNMVMSGVIRAALKGKKMGRSWKGLVGYSVNNLIKHLENLFDNKMTWDNWGTYWEIDHKIPKSWFKYSTAEDIEFKRCWALDNLQPLKKMDNRRKHNRFKSI